MRYIHLNNDSYVLYLSSGLKTVTRTSFNFHKIQKLISHGAEEQDILPLLEVPPLPNGIYKAYEIDGKMVYTHTSEHGICTTKNLQTNRETSTHPEDDETLDSNFVGVYASLEELMDDWPEYLL